jgi:hypothetical protein
MEPCGGQVEHRRGLPRSRTMRIVARGRGAATASPRARGRPKQQPAAQSPGGDEAEARPAVDLELDLTTLTLYGIAASPFALADEHGDSLVIPGKDNRWVERIARAAVVEFGAICAGIGFATTGAQLRVAAIVGTPS